MKTIIILALVVILSGCASGHWYKPGATIQDFNRDKHECSIEAQQVGGVWALSEGAVWRNARLRRNFNSCMGAREWEWVKE